MYEFYETEAWFCRIAVGFFTGALAHGKTHFQVASCICSTHTELAYVPGTSNMPSSQNVCLFGAAVTDFSLPAKFVSCRNEWSASAKKFRSSLLDHFCRSFTTSQAVQVESLKDYQDLSWTKTVFSIRRMETQAWYSGAVFIVWC